MGIIDIKCYAYITETIKHAEGYKEKEERV